MKAELTERLNGSKDGLWKEPGTIIDHPDAWKLVRNGCAVPADEECRNAASMTDEQMREAQAAYQIVSRGIHPTDIKSFKNGEMIGYDEDGEWIPGPNYKEPEEAEPEGLEEFADMIAERVNRKPDEEE